MEADIEDLKRFKESMVSEEDPVENNDSIDKIISLVEAGVVSKTDFNLLVENSVNEISVSDLARMNGLHHSTISNKIRRAKRTIREAFDL